MLVIFYVVGTPFSLDRLRDGLRANDVPAEVLELWFARMLHAAFAATLAGRYAPYSGAP